MAAATSLGVSRSQGGTPIGTTPQLPLGFRVIQGVYDVVRTVARDIASDAVNGTTREWTIVGGLFTADDVGRKLRVAGADNGGNNADHIIEAVISPIIVRTSNATTPVGLNDCRIPHSIDSG